MLPNSNNVAPGKQVFERLHLDRQAHVLEQRF